MADCARPNCTQPAHCAKCGREMTVEVQQIDSYYQPDGTRRIRTYVECPRFARSWRNLWAGGIGHESVDKHGLGGREWR